VRRHLHIWQAPFIWCAFVISMKIPFVLHSASCSALTRFFEFSPCQCLSLWRIDCGCGTRFTISPSSLRSLIILWWNSNELVSGMFVGNPHEHPHPLGRLNTLTCALPHCAASISTSRAPTTTGLRWNMRLIMYTFGRLEPWVFLAGRFLCHEFDILRSDAIVRLLVLRSQIHPFYEPSSQPNVFGPWIPSVEQRNLFFVVFVGMHSSSIPTFANQILTVYGVARVYKIYATEWHSCNIQYSSWNVSTPVTKNELSSSS